MSEMKITGLNISTLVKPLRNTKLEIKEIKETKRAGNYYATVRKIETDEHFRLFIASDDYLSVGDVIVSAFVTASLSNAVDKKGFSAGWVTPTLRKITVVYE